MDLQPTLTDVLAAFALVIPLFGTLGAACVVLIVTGGFRDKTKSVVR